MSYKDDGIPIYPMAKMGDLEHTVATGEDDTPRNPGDFKGAGTEGYKAPVRLLHAPE